MTGWKIFRSGIGTCVQSRLSPKAQLGLLCGVWEFQPIFQSLTIAPFALWAPTMDQSLEALDICTFNLNGQAAGRMKFTIPSLSSHQGIHKSTKFRSHMTGNYETTTAFDA